MFPDSGEIKLDLWNPRDVEMKYYALTNSPVKEESKGKIELNENENTKSVEFC